MREDLKINDDELDEVSGGRFSPGRKGKACKSNMDKNKVYCKNCEDWFDASKMVVPVCPKCGSINSMAD